MSDKKCLRAPDALPNEKPILFSAPMVRAILAGTKTQTRRVVTVPWKGSTRALPYGPYYVDDCDSPGRLMFCDEYGDYHEWSKCAAPYGAPGDRLWVRETWAPWSSTEDIENRGEAAVLADAKAQLPWACVMLRADANGGSVDVKRWRPSIFMPRWASRLLLEVVSVRVERLHAITPTDARAEGIKLGELMPARINGEPGQVMIFDPIKAYAVLWDAINGKRDGCAWASNPWVWVIEFQRIEEKRHAAE